MDVSKLTDVELNRAMIWLNPRLNSFIWTDTGAEVWVGPKTLTNPHWSYLLNWNLTMPLAIENFIWVQPPQVGDGIWHIYNDERFFAKSLNPLRAICEVLVLIALEKK